MSDIVDRVIAGHVLFLQEEGGVAFAFGKDRHEDVCAGDLGTARGLHMDRRALDHALERSGRHRLGAFDIGLQRGEILVDIFHEAGAEFVEIDIAGLQDAHGVRFFKQSEKKVFQRGEFVFAGVGLSQRRVDCLFERVRK